MDYFLFLLLFITSCAGFKVTAPERHVVTALGQPATLGCEFTPDSTADLSLLLVTWQRGTDIVVHSFYHGQNQLLHQSADYRNRTALFVSELHKGNATLRIQPVELRDMGMYQCTVSNGKDLDRAYVHLDYGVMYTEPRLSVNLSCSTVTLLYESEGFPKPDVEWFGEKGEVISNHTTELIEDTDGAGGAVVLYHLKSRYVTERSPVNVTFTLKNQLFNQDLRRPVSVTNVGENQTCGTIHIEVIIFALMFCVLLVLLIAVTLMWRRARHHSKNHLPNGTTSQDIGNELLNSA